MIALIGSIVGFVIFGALMKVAGQRGYAPTPVAAINYVLATVVSAFVSRGDPAGYHIPPVLLIGAVAGVCYVVGFYVNFSAIERAGLSVAQPTVGMAVVIPTLASIALWHEQPTALQVLAIVAVGVAMVLVGASAGSNGGKGKHAASTAVILAALFANQGLVLAAPKVLEEAGHGAQRWPYVTALFAAASLGACARWVAGRDRVSWGGVLVGTGLGLSNVAATAFMSIALATLPGIIVFPVSSVGPMLIGIALGMAVWGERPGRGALIGTAIAVPAVLLLSL